MKDIFRLGLSIVGYQGSTDKPVDINVIKQFSSPFMESGLDTPENDQMLRNMVREFDKVKHEVEQLSQNLKPSQLLENPRIVELMDPVLSPFFDKFFGKDRRFASSGMPDPMKRLLLAIDKEVIRWFEKSGSGKPRDLFDARHNALVGFLTTRSIAQLWDHKLREKFKDQCTPYTRRMLAYLNSYVANRMEGFIHDFLISQPDQSSSQKAYVEALAGRKTLQTRIGVPKLALPSSTILGQEKSLKFMSRGTPRDTLSPRATPVSSAAAQALEKQEKKKEMERKLVRAKLVDDIAKRCGIDKLDYQFYQHLKESIVNSPARGYDNFRRDPIRSCLKRADDWYQQPEHAKRRMDGTADKVKQNLAKEHDTFLPGLVPTLKRMNLTLPGVPFADVDSPDPGKQVKTAKPDSSAESTSKTEESEEESGTESDDGSYDTAPDGSDTSDDTGSGTKSSDERSGSQ